MTIKNDIKFKKGYLIGSFSWEEEKLNLETINSKLDEKNYSDREYLIIDISSLNSFVLKNIKRFFTNEEFKFFLFCFYKKIKILIKNKIPVFFIFSNIERNINFEFILNSFFDFFNKKLFKNYIDYDFIELIKNNGNYNLNKKLEKSFYTFEIADKMKNEINVLFKLNGSDENAGFKIKNHNIFILNIETIDSETIQIVNNLIEKHNNNNNNNNNYIKNIFDKNLKKFIPEHIKEKWQEYNNKNIELENINKKTEELKVHIVERLKYLKVLYSKDTQLENNLYEFLKHKEFDVKKYKDTNKYIYDLLIELKNDIFVCCEIKSFSNVTLKTSCFSQLLNWRDIIKEDFKNQKKIIPLLIFTTEYGKQPNERQTKLPPQSLKTIKNIENIKIISTYNLYEILNKKNGKEELIKKLNIKNNFENKDKNLEIQKIIEIKNN